MPLTDTAQPPPLNNSVTKVLGPPPPNYSPPFRPQPPKLPRPNPTAPVSIVWFRGHDLRVHDHAALDAAVASRATIVALFVLECGPENSAAVTYLRRYSSQSSSYSHPHPDSDVISTITSDSSPAPPIPFSDPKTSRIPLESDHTPWGPLSPNGGFAMGRVQRWYLHHSLTALRQQLQNLGITLILRRVDSADDTGAVVSSVATALGAGAVFWNKRYKPCSYPVDEAVKSALRKRAIHSYDFDSETLMQPSMALCGRYNDFQSYTRFWLDAMRACPPSRPNNPIAPSDVIPMERSRIHHLLAQGDRHSASVPSSVNCIKLPLPSVADLQLLNGLRLEGLDAPGNVNSIGCVAAYRNIQSFLQQDRFVRFSCGRARRDGMVTGDDLATSRLSPHVRFGEISPRVLFYEVIDAGAAAQDAGNEQVVEAARTFLKNMSLREFAYYMLSRYPSAAYKPIMPEFEVFPWKEDEDGAITRAWETGTTGFPIVDAAMRQLLREGWLHNRMRFLAASFFCKYLLLPWQVGAAHLVRTLVDGDEACNSLGWQWTVGCNSDSFPFSTLVNPLSLYTHTQSRKRAAEYVRKYIPELAHLPDRLVFTPWKATSAERVMYRLTLVPFREYNKVCRNVRNCPESTGQSFFYPVRVVTGKDARFRARQAMEVMRRIFAAQRQCRTIIVEQELPGSRTVDRKHPRVSDIESSKKKQRTVEGVEVVDTEGNRAVELDVSELDSTVSSVSDEVSSIKLADRRGREGCDAEPQTVPRKRRRTSSPSIQQKADPPRTPSQTPKIGRPMMSIAQLSTPPTDPNPHGKHHAQRQLSNGDLVHRGSTDQQVPQSESPKKAAVGGNGKSSSPKNMKRPRPVTPNIGHTSAERLSVKSLLSPSLTHDPGMIVHSSPAALLPTIQGGSPIAPGGRSNPLPKLAQVASYQNQSSGNGAIQNDPTTPDVLAGYVPRLDNRSPPALSSDTRPPATPNPRTPQVRSNPHMRGKSQAQHNPNEGMVTPQSSRFVAQSHASPFQYNSPTHDNAGVRLNPRRGGEGDGGMVGSSPNARVAVPQAQMKREMAGPVPPFEVHAAQAPVFHPGVSPVPLISNQYQHSQHHNPQMMVSFRPAPNNPMQMPHMSHAASAMPTPNVSQGYFAANAVNTTPHQPAGQQVLWYPTISPYVELRGHGLPGAVVPHLVHPIPRQHPHGMQIGYPIPGAGAMGAQGDPGRMMPQAGMSVPFPEADGSARRGPNSPLEREAIARRMAAMDYHDDNYGGKHWEQWQAIALHLLNQYEFSEDTDRETSRAYVRLCVLKDELRDANPNGPRVTVNHCKEVFRILNLPVTGEWDRRGHGGVRGPYVYGCVKKSGVQVSRR